MSHPSSTGTPDYVSRTGGSERVAKRSKDVPRVKLTRRSAPLRVEPPGGSGDRDPGPAGVSQGNTRPTQLAPQRKINTGTTRTRRHSPARGGTTAKMPG